MIKKDCPCCGLKKSVAVYTSGEAQCVGNECTCTCRIYCDVTGCIMCANDERGGCMDCSQNYSSCESENYCDETDPEYCSIDFDCPRGNGCDVNLFFHPIWKKFIYCPECGSYEVKRVSEKSIWKFKCTNCGEEFELKRRLK